MMTQSAARLTMYSRSRLYKCMADGADPDDSIPAFEMPAAVHGHGRDAIARFDAETLERLAHAPRLAGELFPVGAHGASVGSRADNLAAVMLTLGMIHQPRDAQREILHRAQKHARLPSEDAHHDRKPDARKSLEGKLEPRRER